MGLVERGLAQMSTVRMMILASRAARLDHTPVLIHDGMTVLYRISADAEKKYLDLNQLLSSPSGIWVSLAISLGLMYGCKFLLGSKNRLMEELTDKMSVLSGFTKRRLARGPLELPVRHVLAAGGGAASNREREGTHSGFATWPVSRLCREPETH